MATIWGVDFRHVLLTLSLVLGLVSASASEKTCLVPASGTNTTDDAPAILDAFQECGRGGTITFSPNTTYYVNSVMNVTWLEDAIVDIQGTLLVSHLSNLQGKGKRRGPRLGMVEHGLAD